MRVLDTYVWRLRRIIEDDPAEPRLLETVHGHGYIFRT
jgi:two-component system phosphate regulon response regulator OmpR